MQQPTELTNSPNRNLVKRKMPESFYKPPLLKTQLCSLEQHHQQRSMHHAHTFSLPIETPISTKTPPSNPVQQASSINNLHQRQHSYTANPGDYSNHVQQNAPKTPLSNLHNHYSGVMPNQNMIINKHVDQSAHVQHPNSFPNNQNLLIGSNHIKTFSLPVAFEPSTYLNKSNSMSSQALPPPSRAFDQSIDVPLPPGWQAEKTSTGQLYFINHLTKTTTWDDPRSLYNLPSNQNEISHDLRLKISKTIPLPTNWEEAVSANGEIYFIDHSTRTTSWEDPRIKIYMQQNKAMNNGNGNQLVNTIYHNSNNSSSSSLYSVGSTSSSSSSLNSLPTHQPHYDIHANNNQIKTAFPPNSSFNKITSDQSLTSSAINNNSDQNNSMVANLKKNLEQVLNQKKLICSQLDELNKKEMILKPKLSQNDLDEVLRILKAKDSSLNGFTQYDNSTANPNKIKPNSKISTQDDQKENSNIHKNSINNVDVDLDSTLVIADSSANNLNISC